MWREFRSRNAGVCASKRVSLFIYRGQKNARETRRQTACILCLISTKQVLKVCADHVVAQHLYAQLERTCTNWPHTWPAFIKISTSTKRWRGVCATIWLLTFAFRVSSLCRVLCPEMPLQHTPLALLTDCFILQTKVLNMLYAIFWLSPNSCREHSYALSLRRYLEFRVCLNYRMFHYNFVEDNKIQIKLESHYGALLRNKDAMWRILVANYYQRV